MRWAPSSSRIGIAEERLDIGPLRRGGRVGDEHGALALAQVAESRFAGVALIAEDSKDVVDDLIGDAEVAAERPERLDGLLVGAGEHGSCLQRRLEGVDGGLQPLHVDDVLDRRRVGVKREVDVEQLPGGRSEHRLVEDLVQALAQLSADAAAVEQPEGVEESEVAGDDGDGETAMLCRGNGNAPRSARDRGSFRRRWGRHVG